MAEVIMNQYEGMFLLPPGAGDSNAQLELVKGMIERHGGQILVLKRWDERKLTYEIKKQKRGVYIIAFFKAASKSVAPLERDVKLSEDVLRVLITRADHLNADEMAAVEPQPIVREERPSYDRPFEGGGREGGGGGRDFRGGDRPRGRRDEISAEMGGDKD